MDSQVICLITIHGIGFQQPPGDGVAGYADDLHTHLCEALNQNGQEVLSDDPDRREYQKGESVPIYVQSVWPPGSLCQEAGLRRLGSWDQEHSLQTVCGPDARLVKGEARIAHVALVYSGLEGEGPEVGSAFIAGAMTVASATRYSHPVSLLDMIFLDLLQPSLHSLWTQMWEHPLHHNDVPTIPSLRVREDESYWCHRGSPPTHPSGFRALLRELENDVAAYVCDNGRRQRIRSFILDALLRLACRDDVAGIVLNTHSNGTTIGLDVVQELPPFAAKKLRAIITAGSPLRKYVDFFRWGEHLATVPKVERWWNFWDPRDIVADRLLPCANWKRGEEPRPDQLVGIYQALEPDKDKSAPIPIEDKEVDNLANSSGGGMQAHNYWDNKEEFIKPVADLLRGMVAEAATAPVSTLHNAK